MVARIANTILLVEFKSVARPANSSTEANYVEEVFRKAPDQLAERIKAIKEDKSNMSKLMKATRYDGCPEDVTLVPAIVTLHLEGSGCEVQGFPIVDSYSLQEFFASNVYEAGFEFGVKDGISRPAAVMTLYSNAREAAQNLGVFLRFNPRIAIRNHVLDTKLIESPDFLLGPSGTVVREYCYVKNCTTDEMRRAVMVVADKWRRIVSK